MEADKKPGPMTIAIAMILTFLLGPMDSYAQRGLQPVSVPPEIFAAEGFESADSAGLFVGIRNFEDQQLAEIPFAVDDAIDLAHLFSVELGLIDPAKIVLALSGDPQKGESRKRLKALLDSGAKTGPAEQSDIYRLLSSQGQDTGITGVFVVAIATHGFSDQGVQYLATSDSLVDRLTRTGVAVSEIFDDIHRVTSAPRRIVLLDACKERLSSGTRSVGGDPNSAMSEAFSNALAAAEGQVVLSATTLGGFSYDDPERMNGVFSAAVMDGLRGQAQADDRSLITAEKLAEYVDDSVRTWVQANRPNHANVSKGIESTFGGAASDMPLAVDPEGLGIRRELRERADRALVLLRSTFAGSDVITAPAFEQARDILSADLLGPEAEELMGWVERLEDGSEHSQMALMMHLGDLAVKEAESILVTDEAPSPSDESAVSRAPDATPAPATTKIITVLPDAEAQAETVSDKSIAVLPFANMSSDEEQEYFSDGLSEELLNLLAKIPQLRVTSRSSSFAFKGEKIEIPELAQRLNVAHILDGSVRKAGNQVRISVQLIEVESDSPLWAETFDRTLEDIFAIQDEIAAAVVAQLKVTLLGAAPTVSETDPEAYSLYLAGRHLRRQRTAESIEQAQGMLEQALAIDPGYAAAWDDLASAYLSESTLGLRPVDEVYTLAREAVDKALVIDPGYAPAYANLSFIARVYNNNLAAAVGHYERALQLEPANTEIIRRAASLIASLGRPDEAIALAEFAVDRDPVNSTSHFNMGFYYTIAERWDEAIASAQTALELSPGYVGGHYLVGKNLLFKGEYQAALEAMQQEDSIFNMIGLPMAYYALGQADESEIALAVLIEQFEQAAPYNIAHIFAFRGQADLAFEWLDKAVQYKDTGLSEILGEPLFSNIHDDPRWLSFLGRIGYGPEQLAGIEFDVTLPE